MADGARMVEEAIRVHAKLDILFCNAGVPCRVPLDQLSEEQWDRVLDVNVKGMFSVIKAAVPHMKDQRSGVIVLTGSELSFVGDPEAPAYSASKGAVLTLTRSLALDLARFGIRVNAICPGTTMTPLGQRLIEHDTPEKLAQRLSRYPLGRFGQPDEIARSVLFLASDDSSYATGTCLVIDGGLTSV